MLYALLRGLARVALRLFYRDVTVVGRERIPRGGPLLIAVNHPNALVDALTAVAVVPRRVTLTAKATLWENPLLRLLLPRVGIVPLRRAQDERARRKDAAGGAAVAATLTAEGIPAANTRDVINLVREGRPRAVQLVRQAGRELGDDRFDRRHQHQG